MAIRHYVLLATDTNQEHELQLPLAPDVCTGDRRGVYAFGFVGGLYKVDDEVINLH